MWDAVITIVFLLIAVVVLVWLCWSRKCRSGPDRGIGSSRHEVSDRDRNGMSMTNMTIIDQASSFVPYTRQGGAQTRVMTQSPSTQSPSMTAPEQITSESSTNWSGYAIQGTNATSVSGTFVIPTILSGTTATNNNVSIWCGIDGLTSSTVQQLGVDLAWVNGRVQSYAWIELYPSGPLQIVGMPITAGDQFQVAVKYLPSTTSTGQASQQYQLTMTNLTRRVIANIPLVYTRTSGTARTSVEWIVEAPYLNGVLPLTDFSSIAWSNCLASFGTTTTSLVPPSHSALTPIALTMVTPTNVIKAAPSAISSSSTSFSVSWRHS